MHFVYKLDHLFQSTRVSNENSSITKTFHFSKLISTQDFFCIQHAIFKLQTGPSLSKYKGFKRKLIYYKDISFYNLISTQDFFFASNMQHSKPHTEISTLSDF